MLKILQPCPLNPQTQTKCGEIFCDSSENFTIFCCYCEIKLFAYEDFLQHINNVHLGATTKDCNDDDDDFDKKDEFKDVNSDELLEALESFDILYDFEDNEEDNSSEEDETVKKVLNVGSRFCKKGIKEEQINSEEPSQDSPSYKIYDPTSPKQKFQTLICTDCQEIFIYKKDYDQHVVEQHIGHKCPKCEMRFRHRHHLKRHYHNVHEEGKPQEKLKQTKLKQRINCPYPECPKSFSVQESLKYHLEFHTMECTFICNFPNCTEAYPSQLRLEQHQKKHTMARTFVCDFENCGKAFPNNQRLKVHREVHAPAKRFICDNCGYSFRTMTALNIHKRKHTGERPFACKICEKSFTSQATLQLHMNTHVTMRPHVCQICQATFGNRQIMKRHMFLHSEEKLFKCQLCDRAFKQPQCLDGHMRRVHWETKPKKRKSSKNIANSNKTTTTTL